MSEELRTRAAAAPADAGADGLTWREDVIVSTVLSMVSEALQQRDEQIKELKALVKELKDRPQLRYRGDWMARDTYEPADLVTFAGSTWYCQIATTAIAPSQNGIATSAWKLFCARGRQGKTGDAS